MDFLFFYFFIFIGSCYKSFVGGAFGGGMAAFAVPKVQEIVVDSGENTQHIMLFH